MDYKLRKGTRVKILKDVREGAPAEGKFGKVDGHEDRDGWLLCTADGKPEREAYDLPDGYVEWNPENEDFPSVNCGIRCRNSRFLLDDGTFIHGGQCYWEPVNLQVKRKMYGGYKELLMKLGTPEDEIPTFEQLEAMKSGSS